MSHWTDNYYINAPELPATLRCRGCGASFTFIEDLRAHAHGKHYKSGSTYREWAQLCVEKVESFERAEDIVSIGLTDSIFCETMKHEEKGEQNGRQKLGRGCYRVVAQHREETGM